MRFPKAFGQALQCGLVHLWVRDLMVVMLMGVISPGGVGVLGGLLSPRCWRGWGFSGSKPGVGKGRGWREGIT